MFDVIFSGTNEKQEEKARYFEIGVKQRLKEECASFADAVAGGADGAAEARLRDLAALKGVHEKFGADPRLAALNKWVQENNAARSRGELIKIISEKLMAHLR